MVDFRLTVLLFLGKLLAFLKYVPAIEEASNETHLLVNFSCLQFDPQFVLRVPIVVLDKKRGR